MEITRTDESIAEETGFPAADVATLRDRFKNSPIQAIKKAEIKLKIKGVLGSLETCSMTDLAKLQGEIAAYRSILSLL
jgi:hypothetical protein